MLLLPAACFAAQTKTPLPTAPEELVRQAVQNEITAANDNGNHFSFRSTKTTPKGSVTKIFVQAHDATAGLVIAYNGKPLTPEQRQAEDARVRRFLSDPDELKKKRNREREDTERTLRIMRAIPDAFLFEYAGTEQSTSGVGGNADPLVKLTFRPNPRYQPPSRVEQVLTGMQGYVLLDAERGRLATIDGTLFRDVSFGWGILGHLDHGGHFLVQQEKISNHDWAISRMSLTFTGKILLIKSLVIDSNEVFSDFKRVPRDLTFAQAVGLLLKKAVPPDQPTSSHAAR
jgi:hypothetical protein